VKEGRNAMSGDRKGWLSARRKRKHMKREMLKERQFKEGEIVTPKKRQRAEEEWKSFNFPGKTEKRAYKLKQHVTAHSWGKGAENHETP